MINYDVQFHIEVLKKEVSNLRKEIIELKGNANDALWDNNDMMRNWKVSQRTLAKWRADGLIEFVQLGSKIWYTREHREAFMHRNSSKINAD